MRRLLAALSVALLAVTGLAVVSAAPAGATDGAPSIFTQNPNRRLVLFVTWSPAESDPRFPVLRYEYTTDNGTTWRPAPSTGTDAAGLPTYDNPMKLTVSSSGAAINRGQRYQVRLRAVNDLGPGEPSTLLSAVIGPAAPTLSATVSGTTISLSWTNSAGAAGYRVKQGGTTIATQTGRGRSVTGAVGTTYSFQVEAYNDGGSNASNTVTVTVPLPAPTLSGSLSGTTVSLSWTAVSGADGYRLYRGTTLVSTTTTRSFSDTGRTQGQSYSYTVEAYKGTVRSARSNTYSVTVPLPQPPAAPRSATVQVSIGSPANGVSNNVRVVGSWSSVSGAAYYSYALYSTDIYGSFRYVTGANTTSTSFTLSGQPHGGAYQLSVQACSWDAGCGSARWNGAAYARTISWPVTRDFASNGPGTQTWVDTETGRRAYFGPQSQPAGIATGTQTCASGYTWSRRGHTMRDGTPVMWRPTQRFNWCPGSGEVRFQTDVGSEPSYNSWTYRRNADFYSTRG